MSLPAFNESGDLPPHVFEASLDDTLARFGTNSDRRVVLARRLERVHRIARSTGHLSRFVVFGSFVTDKPEPNDVDVFMVMDDEFDAGSLTGESEILFTHGSAQDHFGCSVFWIRRLAAIGGEDAAIGDWKIKRDGNERGIIEILEPE